MILHVNMVLLKMNMCIYDVVILILYMCSYFLYVEFISYPTCDKWSPTPLWCIFVGWWRIVVVTFPMMAWSLLVFYRFDFGVLPSGALIRTVGILLCYQIMSWGTLSLFWWCTLRLDIRLYVVEIFIFRCDLLFTWWTMFGLN